MFIFSPTCCCNLLVSSLRDGHAAPVTEQCFQCGGFSDTKAALGCSVWALSDGAPSAPSSSVTQLHRSRRSEKKKSGKKKISQKASIKIHNNYFAMTRSSRGCCNCHPLVQGVEWGDLYRRCCDLCKHRGEKTANKGTAQTSEASLFLTDNDLIYLPEVRRDFVCFKYRCCSALWHHLLFTGSAFFNRGWAQSLPAGGHCIHPAWKTPLWRDSPSFPSAIHGVLMRICAPRFLPDDSY